MTTLTYKYKAARAEKNIVLNIRMLLKYKKAHMFSNLTSRGSTPESEAGAPNKADIMARTSSVTCKENEHRLFLWFFILGKLPVSWFWQQPLCHLASPLPTCCPSWRRQHRTPAESFLNGNLPMINQTYWPWQQQVRTWKSSAPVQPSQLVPGQPAASWSPSQSWASPVQSPYPAHPICRHN